MAATNADFDMARCDVVSAWGPRRPDGRDFHQQQGGAGGNSALHERRRRRRIHPPSMYTSVIVRILSTRTPPLEGHIIDLSETGMSIELDAPIPVGEAVTVQFQVSGLGSQRDGLWAQYAAAGEVVRHDRSDDFPAGPCRIALKLLEISTMTQAQIARYIATYAA